MMCYETFEQYQKDCELAYELRFEMLDLCEMNYDIAKCVCNGIGAEWFPEKLRKMISKLNPSLVIVAQNHDLNYYFGTGTHSDFKAANEALKWNGYKMACHNYKWYDVRRYWVMFQATKFCMELNTCGWPAYVAAIKERKADEAAKVAAQSAKEKETNV